MTQSKPVLCLDEALIDAVIRDDTRSGHVDSSPLNVACVVTSLGRPALIRAWWGHNDHGKLIEDYAADHGVGTVPGSDGAAKTSLTCTRLNDTGGTEYEFGLSWEMPPLPAPEAITHLHTGSLTTTLEPGDTQVLGAACAMSQVGTVPYDPNARPTIMGSPDRSRRRVEELAALTDVVKVSDEDLEWLYSKSTPVEEVIRQWLKPGPSLIIVTRGPWGIYVELTSARSMLVIDLLTTDVVDTVGAGDSFMGSFISGLLNADLPGGHETKGRLRSASWDDIIPALHRATITSGLTVQRAGAYTPTHKEVTTVKAKDLRLA